MPTNEFTNFRYCSHIDVTYYKQYVFLPTVFNISKLLKLHRLTKIPLSITNFNIELNIIK